MAVQRLRTRWVWLLALIALGGFLLLSRPPTPAATEAGAAVASPAAAPAAALAPQGDVLGPKKVMVLRVYFHDYTATSRYTQAQVEGLFVLLDQLWRNTSYNKISITYTVSSLYQLPDNRSAYITDYATGDLSDNGKFWKVLEDAINHAPAGLNWNNVDAVLVVMAETNPAQFHRGQGASTCSLHMGPGGPVKTVGCAIFSENPGDTDVQVWGRWAHEIGHAFQQGGPAHPSNYNSAFELMDANYPGQTGVFEKLGTMAFPGWMPTYKYVDYTVSSAVGPPGAGVGGGRLEIWAMEYNPSEKPNVQAVRAYVTDNLYYMISVRRKVLGDELNGFYTPNGIPDEGVLIERVMEGGNPSLNDCAPTGTCLRWVELKGQGGNSDRLWHCGQTYTGDGVTINIVQCDPGADPGDFYTVYITYGDGAFKPDVMISPWRSQPGNTWETTDIWVDSPVNGYGTYRYGTWNSTFGDTVPRGNGDDPTVGQLNRLYARIRNVGAQTASNVKVYFDITDPPGLGINGANGFLNLGSVTSAQFPGLANIAPGSYTDVYWEWTPDFTPTPEQLAAGNFYFHTCVRVRMDPVTGETVLGNQDGNEEQENIDYFQAVDPADEGAQYDHIIRLRNDNTTSSQYFRLGYISHLSPTWDLDINGGQLGLTLGPGEVREIPIIIKPHGPGPDPEPGTTSWVDILAQTERELKNPTLPLTRQLHLEFQPLGGVRVEARVMERTGITCTAENTRDGVRVRGVLKFDPTYYEEKGLWVMAEGIAGPVRRFLPATLKVLWVSQAGDFSGLLARSNDTPREVICFFGGTEKLATVSSGYVPITEPPVTGTIGTGGGTLIGPLGDFHVQFPSGSVTRTITLTYTRYWAGSRPLAGFHIFPFTLIATDGNGNPVTQFLLPYTLVLTYTEDDFRPLGVGEETLRLLYWHNGGWQNLLPCLGCGIDTRANRATLVANHFTEFTLAASHKLYLPLVLRNH
jgi:hypothetical protein